jgi:hypothetical protein
MIEKKVAEVLQIEPARPLLTGALVLKFWRRFLIANSFR